MTDLLTSQLTTDREDPVSDQRLTSPHALREDGRCNNCGRPRGEDGTRIFCDGSDLLLPRDQVCESVEQEAGDDETKEVVSDDVIKAATKCLAKISHGCDMEVAEKVRRMN